MGFIKTYKFPIVMVASFGLAFLLFHNGILVENSGTWRAVANLKNGTMITIAPPPGLPMGNNQVYAIARHFDPDPARCDYRIRFVGQNLPIAPWVTSPFSQRDISYAYPTSVGVNAYGVTMTFQYFNLAGRLITPTNYVGGGGTVGGTSGTTGGMTGGGFGGGMVGGTYGGLLPPGGVGFMGPAAVPLTYLQFGAVGVPADKFTLSPVPSQTPFSAVLEQRCFQWEAGTGIGPIDTPAIQTNRGN